MLKEQGKDTILKSFIILNKKLQNEINCNTNVFTVELILISETMDAGKIPVSVPVMTNAALETARRPNITI